MTNNFKKALAGLGIAAAAYSGGTMANAPQPTHAFQFCDEQEVLTDAQYMIIREALLNQAAQADTVDPCFLGLYLTISDPDFNKQLLLENGLTTTP